MKEFNFDLENKFCEEHDIKTSWENMKIPQPFTQFFRQLFDFDEGTLSQNYSPNIYHEDFKKNKMLKLLKIKSVFQNLYFLYNNGM